MAKPLPIGAQGDVPVPAGDFANSVAGGQFTAIGPAQAVAFYGVFNLLIWASGITSLTTAAGSASATLGAAGDAVVGSSINSPLVPPGTTVKTAAGTAITMAFMPYSMECQYDAGIAVLNGIPSTAGIVGALVVGPGLPVGTTVTGIVQAPGNSLTGAPQRGIVSISNAPTAGSAPSSQLHTTGFPRALFTPTAAGIPAGTDAAAIVTGPGIEFVGTVELERSFDGGATWVTANSDNIGTLAKYNVGTPISAIFAEPERYMAYRLNCTAFTAGNPINWRMSTIGQDAAVLNPGQTK